MLEASDARMLAEVGMLAAGCGNLAHADVIFGGLRTARPDRAYPLVGLAVARLNAGLAADAVQLLEPVRLADPDEQALILAWRGLALQLAGRCAESKRLLLKVATADGDGALLARQLLGLAESTNDG